MGFGGEGDERLCIILGTASCTQKLVRQTNRVVLLKGPCLLACESKEWAWSPNLLKESVSAL